MRMIIAAIVGMFATTATAAEPTEAQDNALKHAMGAMNAAEHCDSYTDNRTMIASMLVVHGIRIEDIQPGGRFFFTAARHHSASRRTLAELPREEACAIGVYLYGPNGQNVPDLLTKR